MSKPPIRPPSEISFEAVYRRMAERARKKKEKAAEAQAIAEVCKMEYSQVNPRHKVSFHHSKSVLGQRVKNASTEVRNPADLPKRGRS